MKSQVTKASQAIESILRELEIDTGHVVSGISISEIGVSTVSDYKVLRQVDINLCPKAGESWAGATDRNESIYVDANNVRICEHNTLRFDGEYVQGESEVIFRKNYTGEYAWAVVYPGGPPGTITLEAFLNQHPEAVIIK